MVKILGANELSDGTPIIDTGSSGTEYFARGHLSPDAAFVHDAFQVSLALLHSRHSHFHYRFSKPPTILSMWHLNIRPSTMAIGKDWKGL